MPYRLAILQFLCTHQDCLRIITRWLVQCQMCFQEDAVGKVPVLLPLGEGVFLEHLVCGDNQDRTGGLEAYAAFDADDCISDLTLPQTACMWDILWRCA